MILEIKIPWKVRGFFIYAAGCLKRGSSKIGYGSSLVSIT
jgi:hypothetical protein